MFSDQYLSVVSSAVMHVVHFSGDFCLDMQYDHELLMF